MEKFKMNLQLFADGAPAGGDGGAAAAEAVDTGVQAPDAGVQKSRKRENPLANVQYGVQQGTEQVAPAQPGAAKQEAEESFESLIKGKYKAELDSYVQGIVRNRFKQNAENEATLESHKALHEALGKRYNVDPTDINGLMRAITRDPEQVAQMAMERGVTEETMNTILDLEEKSKRLEEIERQSAADMRMRQHFNNLAQRAEAVKAMYPGFDLMTELNNPEFARLTAPGVNVDVKTAYEIVHRDEIMAANAQIQAERMSKAIQANSARPMENGVKGAQSASTVKADPTKLKLNDFREIQRRAARGEKIVF